MLKFITFDANGTLLKLRHPVGQVYSSVALKYGIQSNPKNVEKGFFQSWASMSKQFPNFGFKSIGWQQWWKDIVIQSFTICDTNINKNDLCSTANELIEIFSSEKGWYLAPGCLELLNYLKSNNIKLGVISNVDPRLHKILKSLDVSNYFDFILTSYEVGFMKPDPRIFKLAQDLFQAENPAVISHVGDNVELDHHGALNAGWDPILISEKKQEIINKYSNVDSCKIFYNLYELNDFIKNL